MKQFDLLGWKVRDRVTGFHGVCDHVGLDLYGCVMATVRPEVMVSDKGAQDAAQGQWFDCNRLEKVGDARIMEPVPAKEAVPSRTSSGTVPGPAHVDKPAR